MARPRKTSRPDSVKTSPLINEQTEIFKCSKCGTTFTKQKGNFPASPSILYDGNNHYINWCKTCVNDLFLHYEAVLEDDLEAIWRVCMKFDLYYHENPANMSRKISADRPRISAYISKINIKPYNSKTYDDTIDDESKVVIETFEDAEDVDSPISKKEVWAWGLGFSPDDYRFLNESYDDWKNKVVIDGKAKESLVRELCVLKLQQNNALLAEKIDLYTKLTEAFQKTLDRAHLSPKIEDANNKAGEKPIGVMIEMFENERPISDPLPEWKDVDGIIRLFTIYFLGHLCKMLKLKNKYSKMYEDEMNRYKVEIPELEDADDEDVFEYLTNGGVDYGSNEENESKTAEESSKI